MSLHASIIDPKLFSQKDKQQLVDELFAIHNQIFDGVDKQQFTQYVIDSKASDTNIFIQRKSNKSVGYGAIHLYKFDTLQERIAVIRMEAGFIPEFRGGNNQFHFFALLKAIQYIITHPNRKFYFLGSLIHPSSYVALTNLTKQVWPNITKPEPCENIRNIVSKLSDLFDLEPVDSSNPHVVKVGWKTRDSTVSVAFKQPQLKPAAQFYIQQNPNYKDGHGLITILPVNLKILLSISFGLMHKKPKKHLDRFIAKIPKTANFPTLVKNNLIQAIKLI